LHAVQSNFIQEVKYVDTRSKSTKEHVLYTARLEYYEVINGRTSSVKISLQNSLQFELDHRLQTRLFVVFCHLWVWCSQWRRESLHGNFSVFLLVYADLKKITTSNRNSKLLGLICRCFCFDSLRVKLIILVSFSKQLSQILWLS